MLPHLFMCTSITPTAAPGCLDSQNGTSVDVDIAFAGKLSFDTVLDQNVPASSAVAAALKSVLRRDAAIREQGYLGWTQELDLPNETVTAAMSTRTSRVAALGVLAAAERVSIFEGFDRSVQRVRHVGVNARTTIRVWAGASASSNCFVIGVGRTTPRIDAADR